MSRSVAEEGAVRMVGLPDHSGRDLWDGVGVTAAADGPAGSVDGWMNRAGTSGRLASQARRRSCENWLVEDEEDIVGLGVCAI